MDLDLYALSYWVNMAMFLPVPLLLSLFMTNSLGDGSPCRGLAMLTGVVGVLAVIAFLIAQATWVLYGHNNKLPTWAVNTWLTFDGTNSAYYLASSTVLYVQSLWIKKRRGYEEVKRMVGAKCSGCKMKRLCVHNKKPS